MKERTDVADSLMSFAHDVGVPAELISDHANMLIGPKSDYAKQARFLNIKQTSCEPRTQRQNEFEGETRLYSSVNGKIGWRLTTVQYECGTMLSYTKHKYFP